MGPTRGNLALWSLLGPTFEQCGPFSHSVIHDLSHQIFELECLCFARRLLKLGRWLPESISYTMYSSECDLIDIFFTTTLLSLKSYVCVAALFIEFSSFHLLHLQGKWFWRWQPSISFPWAWTNNPKMLQFQRINQWQWTKTRSRHRAKARKDHVSYPRSLWIWRLPPCRLQSH